MPSLSTILICIFVAYVSHSVYTFCKIFMTPECTKDPCFTSYLSNEPKLQLVLFTSSKPNPITSEVHHVETISEFVYAKEWERHFQVPIPAETRRNGSMHLHVVVAQAGSEFTWNTMKRDGPTVIQRIPLTDYALPQATLFLMGEEATTKKPSSAKASTSTTPVAHFKPKIYLAMLTDLFSLGPEDIPPELANLFRINRDHQFMPIVQNDFLQNRLSDLQIISPDAETKTMSLTINYKPIGIGKLRLLLHMQHAMLSLKKLGFTKRDLDDIKSAFSDTNLYLLCATIIVSSIHLLFDFLSFKNDISFWRSKESYEGLSVRTTLWRGFSHIVILLYLLDSNTSRLVQVPAAIGTVIELWKCKKILRVRIGWRGLTYDGPSSDESRNESERLTKQIDREGMRYLTYLLYPLCIGGAVYSLLYQPHKSWYSWTVNSLVNGVYAFGFLFMLPQLFINYKLKSVAALPWRSFMYKAFNTFIDDIFAFVITMPTAHRLACFRDDIVFLIYLYQRWLYPVDKSRLDDGGSVEKRTKLEDTTEAKKDL